MGYVWILDFIIYVNVKSASEYCRKAVSNPSICLNELTAIISKKNILALVILVILAIYGYADARPQGRQRPTRPPPGQNPIRFEGQLGGFGGAARPLG